jgi:hypothetical protein
MRCGKGHDHGSVAEVKACYGQSGSVAVADYRPNKFPGTCVICGARVDEMAGRVDKTASGNWNVSHLDGQHPARPSTPDAKPVAPVQVLKAAARWSSIQSGYYAVPSLTGNNDLDFFAVIKPDSGKWAGYVFVKRVIGGRADSPVRGSTRVNALNAILEAGPDKAQALFGQTLGRCGVCNRHLTDEISRAAGIGPVCRGK